MAKLMQLDKVQNIIYVNVKRIIKMICVLDKTEDSNRCTFKTKMRILWDF